MRHWTKEERAKQSKAMASKWADSVWKAAPEKEIDAWRGLQTHEARN